MAAGQQQHQEIGNAAEGAGAGAVPEQRRDAAKRHPVAGGSDLDRVLGMMGEVIEQNGETLKMVTLLAHRQDALLQAIVVKQDSAKTPEEIAQLGLFVGRLNKEMRKAKKGEPSFFRRSTWERAEDTAWTAGGIAAGAAVGYGTIELLKWGIRAVSAPGT